LKYLSICSGIEAASVAWEPLGWELDQLLKAGVLDALTTYLSERNDAEVSARQCIYCQKGLDEHANSQCLFGSTKYFSWAAAFRLIKEKPELLRNQ